MTSNLLRHRQSDIAFYLQCFIYLFLVFLVFNFNELYLSLDYEDGLVEWVGALALLVTSIVLFACTFKTKKKTGTENYKFWMFLFAAVSFFWAAGEEISWGQHVLGLHTPEWLSKINGQHETNVHNINKKFFDRTLERLTVLLTLITVFQHVRGRQSFFGFRLPEYPLNMALMLIPIYRKLQTFDLDVWHMGFIAFLAYPILAVMKKDKRMMIYSVMFITTMLIVLFVHHNNLHLFGGKSNFYHEVRETMFSILCVFFASQLLSDVKNDVQVI